MRVRPRVKYRVRVFRSDYRDREYWYGVVHQKRWSWRKIGNSQQADSAVAADRKVREYLELMIEHCDWPAGEVVD